MNINDLVNNIREDGLETKQLVGIVGAAVTFIGVFTPIEEFEKIGNSSFLTSNDILGIILLLLSVATLALSLFNKCRWLWATDAGILLATIAGLFSVLARNSYSWEHMLWGWGVLFTGGILIAAAAALEELSRRK